ncbi:hypothetical protein B0H13DRAFT_1850737 [Mycena leptocephala]|nr:hypothetical protein B0H13DRAFT_1850737 [Mycena leptocephala]
MFHAWTLLLYTGGQRGFFAWGERTPPVLQHYTGGQAPQGSNRTSCLFNGRPVHLRHPETAHRHWAALPREKTMVEKACMGTVLMAQDGTSAPPDDAKFAGATLQRSGS